MTTFDIVSTCQTKACSKCKEIKDIIYFSNRSNRSSGVSSKCKACDAEYRSKHKEKIRDYSAEYYSKHKERKSNTSKIWRQENKDHIKVYLQVNYERNKLKWAEYDIKNADKKRAYRSANKEKLSAYSAKYKKDNPEVSRLSSQNRRARIQKLNGKLSKQIEKKLFELQKGKCPCCGLPLGKDYHLDHITALSKGGLHNDSNMQLLRKKCNLEKHTKDPLDFMQSRGFLL